MSDVQKIQISCLNCGKKLAVPASAVGKRAMCPACQQPFPIRAPNAAPPAPVNSVPPVANAPSASGFGADPLGGGDLLGGDAFGGIPHSGALGSGDPLLGDDLSAFEQGAPAKPPVGNSGFDPLGGTPASNPLGTSPSGLGAPSALGAPTNPTLGAPGAAPPAAGFQQPGFQQPGFQQPSGLGGSSPFAPASATQPATANSSTGGSTWGQSTKYDSMDQAEKAAMAEIAMDNARAERESRGGVFGPESSVFNSGVLGGVAAMVGAAVWFFVGLANGIIFYYPPVLFLIGVGAVIKGLIDPE